MRARRASAGALAVVCAASVASAKPKVEATEAPTQRDAPSDAKNYGNVEWSYDVDQDRVNAQGAR
jgi:hypothetical protein